MSTTKLLNYRTFRDSSVRMPSEPRYTRWPGSVRRTGKSDTSFVRGEIITKGEEPEIFMVYASGAPVWVAIKKEACSEWVVRRTKDDDAYVVYSAGGRAIVKQPESTDDYGLLRNKIHGFQQLAQGWDSYAAEAPSNRAVSAALQLVDELEKSEILPEWVTPTSDSSILMRYRQGDVWYDWEFHSDGDVAVMRKPLFDKETYHDFTCDDIHAFFSGEAMVL